MSTEEKIRALCARVMSEPGGSKFEDAVQELREVLDQHCEELLGALRQPLPAFTKRQGPKMRGRQAAPDRSQSFN